MREEWPLEPVAAVAQVIAGQSPKSEFYNSEGQGEPFYQGKKEFGDRFIGPPTTWTTSANRIAEAGDILMSVRAPVGPVNITQQRICIGRGLAAIRPGPRIDRDFLYYALLERQSEIRGTEGAVFASINKTQIGTVKIPLPPLAEQKRIVAILDEALEAIERAEDVVSATRDQAPSLFVSELRALVDMASTDCETVALSDLATDITDGDHLPPPKSAEGVPFITIRNVNKTSHAIDFSDTFFVPREYFESLKPNRRPTAGDVLYTVTGSFGIPFPVPTDIEFCFQRHIALVRPAPGVSSEWLYYLLRSPQVFGQAEARATGTAQRTVSLKTLRSLQVPKADPAFQSRAVARLDDLRKETETLYDLYELKLQKLSDFRAALLRSVFHGELTSPISVHESKELIA